MLLARTVAHTTDVDGMLHGMTPDQFNEWLAMYRVRPWGIEIQPDEENASQSSSLATFRGMAGV